MSQDLQLVDPLVLVIDDDKQIHDLLRFWLKNLSIELRSFTSTEDFLLEFKKLKPALCIVDIHLGSENKGLKIVEAIRKILGKNPPILIYTNQKCSEKVTQALELGANDYVKKPSQKKIFLEKVQFLLRDHQAIRKSKEKSLPKQYQHAKLKFSIDIEEVHELGIKIKSNSLLSKGCTVLFPPDFLGFTTSEKKCLATVTSNWTNTETSNTGAWLEFDLSQEDFLQNLRTWINSKSQKKEQVK